MKQIINTIILNRKAALVAVGAVALLLCVFTAVPFAAAAFGTGFRAETEPPAMVDAGTYAAALEEADTLRAEAELSAAREQELLDQIQSQQEALDLATEENAALEAALAAKEAQFDLMLSNYSKKYVIEAKLVQDNLLLPDDETHLKLYVTAEEFSRLQVGSVLQPNSDVDFPTADNWSLTVIGKHIEELEGIE